eukprot:5216006-Lingulodinium_polyedra.AAC.1
MPPSVSCSPGSETPRVGARLPGHGGAGSAQCHGASAARRASNEPVQRWGESAVPAVSPRRP